MLVICHPCWWHQSLVNHGDWKRAGPFWACFRTPGTRKSASPWTAMLTLIAYSDGLLEATSPAGKEFGESRLLPVVRGSMRQSAQEVLSPACRSPPGAGSSPTFGPPPSARNSGASRRYVWTVWLRARLLASGAAACAPNKLASAKSARVFPHSSQRL